MTAGAKVGFKIPRAEYISTLREWISGQTVRLRRTKARNGAGSKNKDDPQTLQFRQ